MMYLFINLFTILTILGQYSCSSQDTNDLNENILIEKNSNYFPFDKSFYQKNKKQFKPEKKPFLKPVRRTGHLQHESTSTTEQTLNEDKTDQDSNPEPDSPKDESPSSYEVKPIISAFRVLPVQVPKSTSRPIPVDSPEIPKSVTKSIYSEDFITYNRPPRVRPTSVRPKSVFSENFKTFHRSHSKIKPIPKENTNKDQLLTVDLEQGIATCKNCGIKLPKTEDRDKNPEMFFNRNL